MYVYDGELRNLPLQFLFPETSQTQVSHFCSMETMTENIKFALTAGELTAAVDREVKSNERERGREGGREGGRENSYPMAK